MSRTLLTMTLVTSTVLAAFMTATAGQIPATSVTDPTVQISRQQSLASIQVDSRVPGYMMLAGATVRDHRSNSSGTWQGSSSTPPPVSPGRGEGGVSVSGDQSRRGIRWSNVRDHRECVPGVQYGPTACK
jgi:hypothetical protein